MLGTNDLHPIVDELARAARDGSRALLATVVGVEGSTYRKLGARLIATRARGVVGMVSGGCVEVDVVARCERLFERGVPELVRYDSQSDDGIWGMGLGCAGTMEVLLEPLAGEALAGARDCLARAIEAECGALATIVASDSASRAAPGARFLLDGAGDLVGIWPATANLDPDTRAMLGSGWRARAADSNRAAARIEEGPRSTVLWEMLRASPRLTICGAGADAIPLCARAAEFGWKVRVLDHRPAFARVERFPRADAVIVTPRGAAADILGNGPTGAVVIMSHHFDRDLEFLAAALSSDADYIGLLGPRARRRSLLDALAQESPGAAADAATRLYAPIGLDLGAETPDEIALSIVAELVAVQRGRAGGFLRRRRGSIHPHAALGQRDDPQQDTPNGVRGSLTWNPLEETRP